ncbi:ANTAR domain-containing response regulator [Bacillus alkalicellulosilyticus]|uniref:ANTAR domain-containing response regulator n=1 Tax=Alkalihalobacterium alkalicellulosilyticum TaxID=1912214 RepID=UPI0014834397|nr:ANTAR domain-containing protein [Bacillus alkalicellulosilyticus]
MFDSFLLFMSADIKEQYKPTARNNMGTRLQDLGYRVTKTTDISAVSVFIQQVDALIICSTIADIEPWAKKCLTHRSLPLIWWFHHEALSDSKCHLDIDIDAVLYSNMTDSEIHLSLQLCSNRYLQRIQWDKERELLLSKLEERKHIDKAKAILCEIKHITEPEAYDFIRKQAMHERKRMVDVALSILSLYPLLVAKGEGRK